MNIVLWLVQIGLAIFFAMAGSMKGFMHPDALGQALPFTRDLPLALVRVIGWLEILGAIGLILPSATRIKPKLTPLAAAAFVLVMLLAGPYHLSRGEGHEVPKNVVLALLAAFVAWGRLKRVPIAPKA